MSNLDVFPAEVWTTLAAIDTSQKVQKKMNLSYLSWAWAWAELMRVYPASSYVFEQPVYFSDGSCEVWCELTVSNGQSKMSRRMWLPVMDHKNNSIINPSSRQIADSRMRCLVKAIGMCGLGHHIYAGEDLPDPAVSEAKAANDYKALCLANQASIEAIKHGIEINDYSKAQEAWAELGEEVMTGLWRAPSKGGCFTTEERRIMQTTEFRTANMSQ